MKPLKEALISKDKRKWASKGKAKSLSKEDYSKRLYGVITEDDRVENMIKNNITHDSYKISDPDLDETYILYLVLDEYIDEIEDFAHNQPHLKYTAFYDFGGLDLKNKVEYFRFFDGIGMEYLSRYNYLEL